MYLWDDLQSLEVATNPCGKADELPTELEKTKTGLAELETVGIATVRLQEEHMDEGKQRHAEVINFWNETSCKNLDSLINDINVAKVDSVNISV